MDFEEEIKRMEEAEQQRMRQLDRHMKIFFIMFAIMLLTFGLTLLFG